MQHAYTYTAQPSNSPVRKHMSIYTFLCTYVHNYSQQCTKQTPHIYTYVRTYLHTYTHATYICTYLSRHHSLHEFYGFAKEVSSTHQRPQMQRWRQLCRAYHLRGDVLSRQLCTRERERASHTHNIYTHTHTTILFQAGVTLY